MIQGVVATSVLFKLGVGLTKLALKKLGPELAKLTGEPSLRDIHEYLDFEQHAINLARQLERNISSKQTDNSKERLPN